MNLPRSLVIAMLATSAIGVLVAAGLWWVTWPERTAQHLLQVLSDGQVDGMRTILQPCAKGTDHVIEELLDNRAATPEGWFLRPWDRSFRDLAKARQTFSAKSKECERLGFVFTVERGMVLEEDFIKGGGSH